MPTLARFYGITIRMYFQQTEHNPPHVHAEYGGKAAEVALTGDILEGQLPKRAADMVREWISLHRDELLHIWESQEFQALPPLE